MPEKKIKTKPKKESPAKLAEPAKKEPESALKTKKLSPKKYLSAVGRRKTAVARVRLFTQGKEGIIVNDQPYTDYFKTSVFQKIVREPLEKLKCQEKFAFIVKVRGGGLSAQTEAVRMGIARALVELNPYFRKRLKKAGFLRRDPRMRERKKPGLKRARKAPQWSKR